MKIGSKNMTGRAAAVTAVGSAVLIGGGTVAWSAVAPSIPGPDGVIHACYNAIGNPVGTVRVIDPATGATCSKNERALNFNQTGPQGPQGIQGIQGIPGTDGVDGIDGIDGTDGQDGAPGASGPAGLSHAYHSATGSSYFNNGIPTVVLSASVPAGAYVVNSKVSVNNQDGDSQSATCDLKVGGSLEDFVILDLSANGDQGFVIDAPLQALVRLPQAGTITVACRSYRGLVRGQLTAVAVAAVN